MRRIALAVCLALAVGCCSVPEKVAEQIRVEAAAQDGVARVWSGMSVEEQWSYAQDSRRYAHEMAWHLLGDPLPADLQQGE